jgi:hypothetical protein
MESDIERAVESFKYIRLRKRIADDTAFVIQLGELQTRIEITLVPEDTRVTYWVSHRVHSPDNVGPYRPMAKSGETKTEALRMALGDLHFFFKKAIENGHVPNESWLVPNK